MNKRTVRDFKFSSEIWKTVDDWADEEKFKLIETDDSHRLYQKGRDVLDYPIMLELCLKGDTVYLETWIQASTFDRTRAFFLVPSEMGLESGGFQMALPRRHGRQSVNKLLKRLGQSPIV